MIENSYFERGRLRKAIALLTVLFFTTTNLFGSRAYAGLSMVSNVQERSQTRGFLTSAGLSKIAVPSEQGLILEEFKGKSDRLVVLIQDAHDIPQVQENIRSLIAYFQETFGVDLVALEGATGLLDAQIFRSFPNQKLLTETLKPYHKRGELTGPVEAAILNKCAGDYYGIEDWMLYEKGLRLYQRAMEKENSLLKVIGEKKAQNDAAKKETYSKPLWGIDNSLGRFFAGEHNLSEVLQKLSSVQKPRTNTHLSVLIGEIEQGQTQSVRSITEARDLAQKFRSFIGKTSSAKGRGMEKKFNVLFQEFQTSQITPQVFALKLSILAVGTKFPFAVSSGLGRLMREQKTIDAIKSFAFLEELKDYASQVKAMLLRTPEEKVLDTESEKIRLLNDLIRLELSFEDWKKLKPMIIKREILPEHAWRDLDAHLLFYKNSEMRDDAFLKNLARLMEKRSFPIDKKSYYPALLVAGGFHTERLTHRLKENGISYLLVMPSMGSVPQTTNYRAHMQGEVSWKNYFKVVNGQVGLYAAFVRTIRDKLLSPQSRPLEVKQQLGQKDDLKPKIEDSPEFSPSALLHSSTSVKEWRDQILRDLSTQHKIAESYRYVGFLDEIAKDPGIFSEMEKVDRFIEGLRRLESSGSMTRQNILNLLRPQNILSAAAGNAILSDMTVPMSLVIPEKRESEGRLFLKATSTINPRVVSPPIMEENHDERQTTKENDGNRWMAKPGKEQKRSELRAEAEINLEDYPWFHLIGSARHRDDLWQIVAEIEAMIRGISEQYQEPEGNYEFVYAFPAFTTLLSSNEFSRITEPAEKMRALEIAKAIMSRVPVNNAGNALWGFRSSLGAFDVIRDPSKRKKVWEILEAIPSYAHYDSEMTFQKFDILLGKMKRFDKVTSNAEQIALLEIAFALLRQGEDDARGQMMRIAEVLDTIGSFQNQYIRQVFTQILEEFINAKAVVEENQEKIDEAGRRAYRRFRLLAGQVEAFKVRGQRSNNSSSNAGGRQNEGDLWTEKPRGGRSETRIQGADAAWRRGLRILERLHLLIKFATHKDSRRNFSTAFAIFPLEGRFLFGGYLDWTAGIIDREEGKRSEMRDARLTEEQNKWFSSLTLQSPEEREAVLDVVRFINDHGPFSFSSFDISTSPMEESNYETYPFHDLKNLLASGGYGKLRNAQEKTTILKSFKLLIAEPGGDYNVTRFLESKGLQKLQDHDVRVNLFNLLADNLGDIECLRQIVDGNLSPGEMQTILEIAQELSQQKSRLVAMVHFLFSSKFRQAGESERLDILKVIRAVPSHARGQSTEVFLGLGRLFDSRVFDEIIKNRERLALLAMGCVALITEKQWEELEKALRDIWEPPSIPGVVDFSNILARFSKEMEISNDEQAKIEAGKKAFRNIILLAGQVEALKTRGRQGIDPAVKTRGENGSGELWMTGSWQSEELGAVPRKALPAAVSRSETRIRLERFRWFRDITDAAHREDVMQSVAAVEREILGHAIRKNTGKAYVRGSSVIPEVLEKIPDFDERKRVFKIFQAEVPLEAEEETQEAFIAFLALLLGEGFGRVTDPAERLKVLEVIRGIPFEARENSREALRAFGKLLDAVAFVRLTDSIGRRRLLEKFQAIAREISGNTVEHSPWAFEALGNLFASEGFGRLRGVAEQGTVLKIVQAIPEYARDDSGNALTAFKKLLGGEGYRGITDPAERTRVLNEFVTIVPEISRYAEGYAHEAFDNFGDLLGSAGFGKITDPAERLQVLAVAEEILLRSKGSIFWILSAFQKMLDEDGFWKIPNAAERIRILEIMEWALPAANNEKIEWMRSFCEMLSGSGDIFAGVHNRELSDILGGFSEELSRARTNEARRKAALRAYQQVQLWADQARAFEARALHAADPEAKKSAKEGGELWMNGETGGGEKKGRSEVRGEIRINLEELNWFRAVVGKEEKARLEQMVAAVVKEIPVKPYQEGGWPTFYAFGDLLRSEGFEQMTNPAERREVLKIAKIIAQNTEKDERIGFYYFRKLLAPGSLGRITDPVERTRVLKIALKIPGYAKKDSGEAFGVFEALLGGTGFGRITDREERMQVLDKFVAIGQKISGDVVQDGRVLAFRAFRELLRGQRFGRITDRGERMQVLDEFTKMIRKISGYAKKDSNSAFGAFGRLLGGEGWGQITEAAERMREWDQFAAIAQEISGEVLRDRGIAFDGFGALLGEEGMDGITDPAERMRILEIAQEIPAYAKEISGDAFRAFGKLLCGKGFRYVKGFAGQMRVLEIVRGILEYMKKDSGAALRAFGTFLDREGRFSKDTDLAEQRALLDMVYLLLRPWKERSREGIWDLDAVLFELEDSPGRRELSNIFRAFSATFSTAGTEDEQSKVALQAYQQILLLGRQAEALAARPQEAGNRKEPGSPKDQDLWMEKSGREAKRSEARAEIRIDILSQVGVMERRFSREAVGPGNRTESVSQNYGGERFVFLKDKEIRDLPFKLKRVLQEVIRRVFKRGPAGFMGFQRFEKSFRQAGVVGMIDEFQPRSEVRENEITSEQRAWFDSLVFPNSEERQALFDLMRAIHQHGDFPYEVLDGENGAGNSDFDTRYLDGMPPLKDLWSSDLYTKLQDPRERVMVLRIFEAILFSHTPMILEVSEDLQRLLGPKILGRIADPWERMKVLEIVREIPAHSSPGSQSLDLRDDAFGIFLGLLRSKGFDRIQDPRERKMVLETATEILRNTNDVLQSEKGAFSTFISLLDSDGLGQLVDPVERGKVFEIARAIPHFAEKDSNNTFGAFEVFLGGKGFSRVTDSVERIEMLDKFGTLVQAIPRYRGKDMGWALKTFGELLGGKGYGRITDPKERKKVWETAHAILGNIKEYRGQVLRAFGILLDCEGLERAPGSVDRMREMDKFWTIAQAIPGYAKTNSDAAFIALEALLGGGGFGQITNSVERIWMLDQFNEIAPMIPAYVKANDWGAFRSLGQLLGGYELNRMMGPAERTRIVNLIQQSFKWDGDSEHRLQMLKERLSDVAGRSDFSDILARFSEEVEQSDDEPAKIEAGEKAFDKLVLLADQVRALRARGQQSNGRSSTDNTQRENDKELWWERQEDERRSEMRETGFSDEQKDWLSSLTQSPEERQVVLDVAQFIDDHGPFSFFSREITESPYEYEADRFSDLMELLASDGYGKLKNAQEKTAILKSFKLVMTHPSGGLWVKRFVDAKELQHLRDHDIRGKIFGLLIDNPGEVDCLLGILEGNLSQGERNIVLGIARELSQWKSGFSPMNTFLFSSKFRQAEKSERLEVLKVIRVIPSHAKEKSGDAFSGLRKLFDNPGFSRIVDRRERLKLLAIACETLTAVDQWEELAKALTIILCSPSATSIGEFSDILARFSEETETFDDEQARTEAGRRTLEKVALLADQVKARQASGKGIETPRQNGGEDLWLGSSKERGRSEVRIFDAAHARERILAAMREHVPGTYETYSSPEDESPNGFAITRDFVSPLDLLLKSPGFLGLQNPEEMERLVNILFKLPKRANVRTADALESLRMLLESDGFMNIQERQERSQIFGLLENYGNWSNTYEQYDGLRIILNSRTFLNGVDPAERRVFFEFLNTIGQYTDRVGIAFARLLNAQEFVELTAEEKILTFIFLKNNEEIIYRPSKDESSIWKMLHWELKSKTFRLLSVSERKEEWSRFLMVLEWINKSRKRPDNTLKTEQVYDVLELFMEREILQREEDPIKRWHRLEFFSRALIVDKLAEAEFYKKFTINGLFKTTKLSDQFFLIMEENFNRVSDWEDLSEIDRYASRTVDNFWLWCRQLQAREALGHQISKQDRDEVELWAITPSRGAELARHNSAKPSTSPRLPAPDFESTEVRTNRDAPGEVTPPEAPPMLETPVSGIETSIKKGTASRSEVRFDVAAVSGLAREIVEVVLVTGAVGIERKKRLAEGIELMLKVLPLERFVEVLRTEAVIHLARVEKTVKAVKTPKLDRELAEKAARYFTHRLARTDVQGDLAVAFDLTADRSLQEALVRMHSRIGLAVLPKALVKGMDPKILEGIPYQVVSDLKRLKLPLAVENIKAVPVVGNGVEGSLAEGRNLFGVRIESADIQGEPFLEVVEKVVQIASGLLVAGRVKSASELKNPIKAEEIRAFLLKQLFEDQGASNVIFLRNGEIFVSRALLRDFITQYLAAQTIKQSA